VIDKLINCLEFVLSVSMNALLIILLL